VEVGVAAADKNCRLGGGGRSIQITFGFVRPQEFALWAECMENAFVVAEEDLAADEVGRGGDFSFGFVFPLDRAAVGVECVKPAVCCADIDCLAGRQCGGLYLSIQFFLPEEGACVGVEGVDVLIG